MLSVLMAVALFTAVGLRASETPAANSFFGTLSTVSPAELPATSAGLVAQADSKNLLETTVNVVKAAVGLNPAAAAAIVGTIAQSTPKMASVAAATAVALVPSQAVAIARAAAAAAPSEAGKVVEAVCRVVPAAYKDVASAVAGVVPNAGSAILAGITNAIPSLQGPIDKALAASSGVNTPLSKILDQVPSVTTPVTAAALNAPMAITPAIRFGPPYVQPPPSPVNYSTGTSGQELPGGRSTPAP
jgi:hypothetical protein